MSLRLASSDGATRGDPRPLGTRKIQVFCRFLGLIDLAVCDTKSPDSWTPPGSGHLSRRRVGMTVRSLGASLAAMVLVSTMTIGCSNKAEQSANRAEDAAKRAESAASRVEAAAQRAEAAAEKAERLFSKHMHK